MQALTQPLRDEHKELLPSIEKLRTLADAIGETPTDVPRQGIDDAYEFLTHQLIPHAQAEERVLYPAVGRAMGAVKATATMSRDHVEIGRLGEELAALRAGLSSAAPNPAQAKALRRVLYGLYALLMVHFAKEEEIYLPILDAQLTPSEARQMFEAMEHTAKEAKQQP